MHLQNEINVLLLLYIIFILFLFITSLENSLGHHSSNKRKRNIEAKVKAETEQAQES